MNGFANVWQCDNCQKLLCPLLVLYQLMQRAFGQYKVSSAHPSSEVFVKWLILVTNTEPRVEEFNDVMIRSGVNEITLFVLIIVAVDEALKRLVVPRIVWWCNGRHIS